MLLAWNGNSGSSLRSLTYLEKLVSDSKFVFSSALVSKNCLCVNGRSIFNLKFCFVHTDGSVNLIMIQNDKYFINSKHRFDSFDLEMRN